MSSQCTLLQHEKSSLQLQRNCTCLSHRMWKKSSAFFPQTCYRCMHVAASRHMSAKWPPHFFSQESDCNFRLSNQDLFEDSKPPTWTTKQTLIDVNESWIQQKNDNQPQNYWKGLFLGTIFLQFRSLAQKKQSAAFYGNHWSVKLCLSSLPASPHLLEFALQPDRDFGNGMLNPSQKAKKKTTMPRHCKRHITQFLGDA